MNDLGFFEIHVDQPQRAMDFYGGVFGWKFPKMDGWPVDYWRIITGADINGGLLKRPVKSNDPSHGVNAFVCSMRVKNFDKTATKIMEKGGQIAMDKFPVPGVCWQGYFLDHEGNTFGIFQPDETAK